MKIGIIGVQSKHAEFFGEIWNLQNRYPGSRVTHIYPVDEPERLPYVLARTGIQHVCDDAETLIASVDAVLITTRLAGTHYDFTVQCVEGGKPVFVDKPFVAKPEQARELIAFAARRKVPLVAGSTLCFLPEIPQWKPLLADAGSVLLRYWADPDSPFGGYSFYGSHLTDLASLLFGGALRVTSRRTGSLVTSVVEYQERQVVLQTSEGPNPLECVFDAEAGLRLLQLDEAPCYACGMDAFWNAIQAGHSMQDPERLVASVCLLGAIHRSLASGCTEAIS